MPILFSSQDEPYSLKQTRRPNFPPKVGQKIHYHVPNTAGGLVTTVTEVLANDLVKTAHDGKPIVRGGFRNTRFGDDGTWSWLDMRHRRHVRIHGTFTKQLFQNLKEPGLMDWWLEKGIDWRETCVDVIVQTESTLGFYDSIIDEVGDLAGELGIPLNFGILCTVAGGVTGFSSTAAWWTPSAWDYPASRVEHYYRLLEGRVGPWLHCQMETVEPVQAAVVAELEAAGKTRQDIIDAQTAYRNVIQDIGFSTILRPMAVNDCGLPPILEAGGPGSVYCTEVMHRAPGRMQKSEKRYREALGGYQKMYNQLASQLPPWARHVPLHLESDIRVLGTPWRANMIEETPFIPIIEFYEQVEGWVQSIHGLPSRSPHIMTKNWYYMTTKLPSGNKLPSANDAAGVWAVSDTSAIAVSSKTFVGSLEFTSGAVGIQPWRRRVSSGSLLNDNVDGTIPEFKYGLKPWLSSSNDARCFRIAGNVWTNPTTNSASVSFTLNFSWVLSDAPPSGTIYAVCGNVQSNALVGSFNVIDDGALKMNVPAAAGEQQTWVIDENPVRGQRIPITIGYDDSRKMYLVDKLGFQSASLPRTGSALAILFGGTHDILDRTSVVWGTSGSYLPFDSDVVFWHRAISLQTGSTGYSEFDCVRDQNNRWPYGYNF